MIIKRDLYLNKLIDRINNGLIKVITGIRRCGKSTLLFDIFYQYLIKIGTNKNNIIKFAFDSPIYLKQIGENLITLKKEKRLVDPNKFLNYIQKNTNKKNKYFLLLDEVQYLDSFELVLNGFLYEKNLEVYVTGSNSKFLSTDIITEFRGRGDEIRIFPLSFSEYYQINKNDKYQAWDDYHVFGGMPGLFKCKNNVQKIEYLKSLITKVYLTDIIERNKILYKDDLKEVINFLSSASGSLINPKKIINAFKSIKNKSISEITLKKYLNYLTDAFLFNEAKRYDVKGKKYINTPIKYYPTDIGLRNANLDFRQIEENHIMENVIFNELKIRGYSVDVGVVNIRQTINNIRKDKQLEIDFIANKGLQKYYIQSCLFLSDFEKIQQEKLPLIKVNDAFKKILIVKDFSNLKIDENGIATIGLINFLLDQNCLNF